MTTLSYTVPVAGTDLNSVADPEIATALTAIKTWANGNIDSSNITSTSGYTQLAIQSISSNTNATAGQLLVVTSSNPTVTLPAATSNAVVGVFVLNGAVSGSAQVTITGASNSIYGLGAAGVTSIKLGTPYAYVLLQSDGTKWYIVSGQQDSGWISLSLGSGVAHYSGSYTPSYRIRGDQVWLSGGVTISGGSTGTIGTNAPAPALTVGMATGYNQCGLVIAGSSSSIAYNYQGSYSSGDILFLDGCNYRLV